MLKIFLIALFIAAPPVHTDIIESGTMYVYHQDTHKWLVVSRVKDKRYFADEIYFAHDVFSVDIYCNGTTMPDNKSGSSLTLKESNIDGCK